MKTIKFILPFVLCLLMATQTIARETRTTNAGYPASTSEQFLDKAVEYASAHDDEALQELLDTGLVFLLKGGMEVYIVDTKLFSGKVKIRLKGSTTEVWTLYEAISK